jgi:Heparinase II/III-like protein
MPASGYCVVRSNWSKDADYLCFDCGPQAAGLRRDEVPSAAHGHADCLSVVLSLGGREVLVDPGFFCYNGDPVWEVHFRKTRAHNTIVVDDSDQARHVSKMAWTHTYAPKFEGAATGRLGWASGSHDGYARQSAGVTHRRTAWLRPDGYLVIRDELSGVPGHSAEAVFQFAPGTVTLTEASALFDDRFELIWVSSEPVEAQVSCGGDLPSTGWIASSLGVRQPAPRLALRFEMRESHTTLLTLLVDRERCSGGRRTSSRGQRSNDPLRACVAGDRWVDDVIAAVRAPVTMPDVDTDAPLVILRSVAGSIIEAAQAGGSRLDAAGVDPSRTPAGHQKILVVH